MRSNACLIRSGLKKTEAVWRWGVEAPGANLYWLILRLSIPFGIFPL